MNIINNIVAASKTAANTIKRSPPVRGVKRFAHNVRVEFEAQRIVAAQRAVKREEDRVAAMSREEQREYMLDTAEILIRASELHRSK